MLTGGKELEGRANDWYRGLGIQIPVASFIIQVSYPSHPDITGSVETRFPETGAITWLTSKIELPEAEDKSHLGFVIVNSLGWKSNLGVAIPRISELLDSQASEEEEQERKPFWFFWNRFAWKPEIVRMEKLAVHEGMRRIVGEEEKEGSGGKLTEIAFESLSQPNSRHYCRLWEVSHGALSQAIPLEQYLLGYYPTADLSEIVQSSIKSNKIISGIKARGGRLGLKPSVPFEYLLGRYVPLLARRPFSSSSKDRLFPEEEDFVY